MFLIRSLLVHRCPRRRIFKQPNPPSLHIYNFTYSNNVEFPNEIAKSIFLTPRRSNMLIKASKSSRKPPQFTVRLGKTLKGFNVKHVLMQPNNKNQIIPRNAPRYDNSKSFFFSATKNKMNLCSPFLCHSLASTLENVRVLVMEIALFKSLSKLFFYFNII